MSLGEHLFLARMSANLYRGVQAERQEQHGIENNLASRFLNKYICLEKIIRLESIHYFLFYFLI